MLIAQALTGVVLPRRADSARARSLVRGLMLVVAGVIAGCGDQRALDPGSGSSAEIQLDIHGPLYLMTLAITVTGPGIDAPLVFNFPFTGGTATGDMTVPAGSRRRIVALAYDSLGVNTHAADTTVSVLSGTSPSVSILLWPLNGQVPVVVTGGSYSVTVTPGDTTLTTGDTLRFHAAVTRGSTPVPNAPTVWASTLPWVATVDTTGKVRARNAGQARIVATVNGAMASRRVVVAP